jgi:hypothetical protein
VATLLQLAPHLTPQQSAAQSLRMLLGQFVAALDLVPVVFLFGPSFASFDCFAGHVAGIVMVFSRTVFARLLLIRIFIVRHGTLL